MEGYTMTYKQAISRAKQAAIEEAPFNDYADSMYYIVKYSMGGGEYEWQVMSENEYDFALASLDIYPEDCKANTWSDGTQTEVTEYI